MLALQLNHVSKRCPMSQWHNEFNNTRPWFFAFTIIIILHLKRGTGMTMDAYIDFYICNKEQTNKVKLCKWGTYRSFYLFTIYNDFPQPFPNTLQHKLRLATHQARIPTAPSSELFLIATYTPHQDLSAVRHRTTCWSPSHTDTVCM